MRGHDFGWSRSSASQVGAFDRDLQLLDQARARPTSWRKKWVERRIGFWRHCLTNCGNPLDVIQGWLPSVRSGSR